MNQTNNIREEFDKYKNHFINNHDWRLWNTDLIADWWLSHSFSKEELMEWIKPRKKNVYQGRLPEESGFMAGYNQALSDLQDFLNKKI